MKINEIEKVAKELKKIQLSLHPNFQFSWNNPSLNILDCVLSLNRNYYSMVKPRLDRFKDNHPDCFSIEDLIDLFQDYKCNYGEFTVRELDYNHADRGRIIFEVAEYLLKEISKDDSGTQIEKLEKWAINAKPEDAYTTGIKGFGLAGFQYLRILFGAQTAKPDVHVINYLSNIIDRKLSNIGALNLLEKAAPFTGIPIRELDLAIWEYQSSL